MSVGSLTFSVGEMFNSFAEFDIKLQKFQQENLVQFVKQTCHRLNEHPDSERLQYNFVKFCCKKGAKRKSKSRGLRPNQRTVKEDCIAYIRLVKVKEGQQAVLKVNSLNLNHTNHSVIQKDARDIVKVPVEPSSLESVPRTLQEPLTLPPSFDNDITKITILNDQGEIDAGESASSEAVPSIESMTLQILEEIKASRKRKAETRKSKHYNFVMDICQQLDDMPPQKAMAVRHEISEVLYNHAGDF